MDKRKYIKRGIAVTGTTVIIAVILLAILNTVIYKSLETNLQNKLIEADKQRVFALEQQFSVFSTAMNGISASIRQMDKDGFKKVKVRIRILLSDLSRELGTTTMCMCDEAGNSIVGVNVDLDEHKAIKETFETKEGQIMFTKLGTQGERESLMFTTPVVDTNGENFVLYATIAREIMSKVFNASTTYEHQNIMVVQEDDSEEGSILGEVILPMEDTDVQKKVMGKLEAIFNDKSAKRKYGKIIRKNLDKDGFVIERVNIENYEQCHIAIVKLADLPWYFVSTVPASEADVYINEATDRVILVFGILLLLFVSVIVFVMYLQYRNQSKVFNLAYYDRNTGLYNWDYMQIKLSEKEYKDMAIVLFDIQGLKYINELYGYPEGDRIIIGLAEYLKHNRIIEDVKNLYCKLNDDAFAATVESKINDDLIEKIRNYVSVMQKTLSKQFEVNVTVSVAKLEKSSKGSYQTSLDNAHSAMEVIKKKQQNEIGVYDQELRDEELMDKKIESDLPDAIKDKDLVVYYQPKYEAKTERLVGAEALVRWKHKDLGFLSPGRFIPLLEESGKIGKVDMYVLEDVCRYINYLTKEKLTVPIVSVNLSRAEINEKNLVNRIMKLRKKYDVSSNSIEIEITESSMNNNENKLIEISEELHKAGFSLAIDDFGTGYSSFSQLIKMPIDTLKLDKSFIDSYEKEGRGSNVHVFITDVIQLAKHIHCQVVAEGVETKEQRDMLVEAECDIIQGYYYGRPMPELEFTDLIKKEMKK